MNQDVIKKLINIGIALDAGEVPVTNAIRSLSRFSSINRVSKKIWHDEVSQFGISKLVSLLKGLTFIERELSWLGGSAGGVIWIFEILLTRDIDISELDSLPGGLLIILLILTVLLVQSCH